MSLWEWKETNENALIKNLQFLQELGRHNKYNNRLDFIQN